jgi:hypothetical protein
VLDQYFEGRTAVRVDDRRGSASTSGRGKKEPKGRLKKGLNLALVMTSEEEVEGPLGPRLPGAVE